MTQDGRRKGLFRKPLSIESRQKGTGKNKGINHQTLTLSPLGPGVPAMPLSPGMPWRPGGPVSPTVPVGPGLP